MKHFRGVVVGLAVVGVGAVALFQVSPAAVGAPMVVPSNSVPSGEEQQFLPAVARFVQVVAVPAAKEFITNIAKMPIGWILGDQNGLELPQLPEDALDIK